MLLCLMNPPIFVIEIPSYSRHAFRLHANIPFIFHFFSCSMPLSSSMLWHTPCACYTHFCVAGDPLTRITVDYTVIFIFLLIGTQGHYRQIQPFCLRFRPLPCVICLYTSLLHFRDRIIRISRFS